MTKAIDSSVPSGDSSVPKREELMRVLGELVDTHDVSDVGMSAFKWAKLETRRNKAWKQAFAIIAKARSAKT